MSADIDYFGHATYSSYLRWQSVACDLFLFERFPDWRTVSMNGATRFSVRASSMRYRAGAGFGTIVEITTNVSRITEQSFELCSLFVRKSDSAILATGTQVMSVLDGQGCVTPLAEAFRARLSALLETKEG